MICDKILFNGEVIITILHNGFSDEVYMPKKRITEGLNDYLIEFTEHTEPLENIVDGLECIDKGFLDVQSSNNPYKGGSHCAVYERYSGDMPEVLFETTYNEITPKVTFDELERLFEFIKNYTSIDVSHDITLMGDILLYEPRKANIKKNRTDKYLEFENASSDMYISVNFYKYDTIVSSCVIKSDESSDVLQIITPDDWGRADITIYKNGELFYKNANFSLIRSISVRFYCHDIKMHNCLTIIVNQINVLL